MCPFPGAGDIGETGGGLGACSDIKHDIGIAADSESQE